MLVKVVTVHYNGTRSNVWWMQYWIIITDQEIVSWLDQSMLKRWSIRYSRHRNVADYYIFNCAARKCDAAYPRYWGISAKKRHNFVSYALKLVNCEREVIEVHIDGFVQNWVISSANALEIPQFCTIPSISTKGNFSVHILEFRLFYTNTLNCICIVECI